MKTNQLLFSSLVLGTLLVGCGGGGGSSAALKTGVFLKNVKGLHYKTSTTEGLTNADGEFEYREGEDITFSLGGITLGMAQAKVNMSPFDLVGISAPESKKTIYSGLGYDTHAGEKIITPFMRAVNMTRLLMVFDADQNTANGIDLGDADNDLTSESLNFNQIYYAFPEAKLNVLTNRYNVKNTVRLYEPIVYLYNTLGITVATDLNTKISNDKNNDGTPEWVRMYEYDTQGRLVQTGKDANLDTVYESGGSVTYDANSNIIRYYNRDDYNNDALINNISEVLSTYTANNQLSREVYKYDDDADGNFDSVTTTINTYDSLGNQLTSLESRDTDNNGDPDWIKKIFMTYDSDGNQTLKRIVLDTDLTDPSPNRIVITSSTYDSEGNKLVSVHETDTNGDTVTDSKITTTNTHDANGNILVSTTEKDTDNDTVIDKVERITQRYNNNGLILEYIREVDNTGGGIFIEKRHETYRYNDENRLVSSRAEDDTNDDGVPDYIKKSTYTYDDKNRIMRFYWEYDNNADTVPDGTHQTDYSYDAQGNVIQRVKIEDTDGDGISDKSKSLITYNLYGSMVSRLTERDSGNDGTVDSARSVTYEYQRITDGLKSILDDLLSF